MTFLTDLNDLPIDKQKTLCVSGHRTVKEDLDESKLEQLFIRAISFGIDTFLVGMAVGFDTICFKILKKLRKNKSNNIRIIACIPCPEQDKYFSPEQKKDYQKMLKDADQKIIISPFYTSYCMMKRNRFMVDNSGYLIAYLTENHGGTFSTVKYAKEKKLKITILPAEQA